MKNLKKLKIEFGDIMKKILILLEYFFSGLLELIYPEINYCFICDKYDEEINESYICYGCKLKLEFINSNICDKCGKLLPIYNDLNICSNCLVTENYFDKAISPLKYSGILKDAIYKFKYKNGHYMYKLFGQFLLEEYLKNNLNSDLIVPVPLHKKRKNKRGYNQSELLSKFLGKKLNIKVDTKNLIRVKNTSVQNKLSKEQRIHNLENAFKVLDKNVFKNKSILLIDDIFTTGTTVNECSKVLKECNPKEIIALTIATV